MSTQVITQPKSAGIGFLLGFLFGPFGLFYVSVVSGIVAVAVYLRIVFITGGLGLVAWIFFGILGAILAPKKMRTKTVFVQDEAPTPA